MTLNPPVFVPGVGLTAGHLIRLEEYLLARSSMTAPDHGVIRQFAGDQGPYQEQDRLYSLFVLDEVVGITPGGRPVQFKAGADIPPLKFPFRAPAEKPLICDIYVTDRHQKPENDTEEAPAKYRIGFDKIEDEQLSPALGGDRLYLGRYKLQDGAAPEMIEPPLPYCLAAVRYPSDWWNKWTFPIRKALRAVAEDYADNPLVVRQVTDIAFHYPHWPLSQLVRACYQLQWLKSNPIPLALLDEGMMQEMSQLPLPGPGWNLLQGKLPFELPAAIAGIFGNEVGGRWQLLSPLEYTRAGNLVTLKRQFPADCELKIQFKEAVDTFNRARFTINGQTTLLVDAATGEDTFNRPCWYYVLDYAPPFAGPFSLRIPSNLPAGFSIYYRPKTGSS